MARAIRVASEGVWIDLVTQADAYSNDEALLTVLATCAAFFPRHFDAEGGLMPVARG